MKDLQIVALGRDTVRPFTTYLLPQIFQSIENGEEMVLLGAYAQGHSLGAAAAQERDGVMKIRSLYVAKPARRQGVGSALLTTMAIAFERLGTPVHAAAVEYMVLPEENGSDIAAFLRRMGFEKPVEGNRLFEVSSRVLRERPLLKKAFSADFRRDSHVMLFSELSPGLLRSMDEMEEAPDYLRPACQQKGMLKQASTAWVQDGQIMGWLLIRQGFDGELILSSAFVRKSAPGTCFARMLQASANRAYLMLGRDFNCYISTINDYAGHLVDKVTGENKKEYATYGAVTTDRARWLR